MSYRVPFGNLRIGESARRRIAEALDSNWISEGRLVREFEEKFAAKFGWKHAIATSSGTTAGEVVWSAVRELAGCPRVGNEDQEEAPTTVLTPACAFVSTASCILAVGMQPKFIDVDLSTLNIDGKKLVDELKYHYENLRIEDTLAGIQFVANMGKPMPILEVAEIAGKNNLWLVGDFCEAHGATFQVAPAPGKEWTANYGGTWQYADHYCDAAIYSFYVAHMIVGGEGGIICTDDDELAEMCRSIKNHGRPPGSNYFDFRRIGFNSKWNDLCAAIALESLEKFDETFAKRREVRQKLLDALSPFGDRLILYRDAPGEVISPHAFPLVLKDPDGDIRPLYEYLDKSGIQVKTLFGSLPTDHAAFRFLGYTPEDFPIAESIGRRGLHFSCGQFLTDNNIVYIAETIGKFFLDNDDA